LDRARGYVLLATKARSQRESTVNALTKINWKAMYWPSIHDQESAKKAVTNAANMAFFVSGSTALFSTLTLFGVFKLMSPAALIDAILFFLIGIGIRCMWRSAAVIGLLLYVSKVAISVAHMHALVVIYTLTTLLFANGIRGTFAYRKSAAFHFERPRA
jgi:hypothetical protein